MPYSPKPRCPVCGRLHCKTEAHRKQPRQRTERLLERPDRNTRHERRRRTAVVDSFIAQYGITLENGDVIARCPDCRQMRAKFVADHVEPLAYGGHESGSLRVHCARCSGKQGAMIANRKRGRAQF